MEILSNNYQTLSDYYLQIMGRCINQEMRLSLDHRIFPSSLKIPGEYSSPTKTFSQRIASHNPEKIILELVNELHDVGEQTSLLWRKMLDLISKSSRSIINLLREQFNVDIRNFISKGLIRKIIRTQDFVRSSQNMSKVNQALAETRRKENLKLNSLNNQGKLTDTIIIDEVYLSDSNLVMQNSSFSNIFVKSRKKLSELHLMILVHGYQGSSKDLQVLRNEISIMFPYTVFLISAINEKNTESTINELGSNLSKEVKCFLRENSLAHIGNISFIGHSLGGLIIRAALPSLLDYSSKFHLFLTLSTPHLGIQEASKLVRAGVWIMNYVKKADSLTELRLADSKNIEKTFLYQLSSAIGPDLFTHFVVISSPQDSYSPHFSSRIEVSKKIFKRNKIYLTMGKNIIATRDKMHRIDVDFKIFNTNIDSIIGRAGHIEFLDNRHFMKFLLYLHPEFFE